MTTRLLLLALAFGSLPTLSARAIEYTDVYPAEADPLMGDWEGRWSEQEDVDPEMAAQVIPLGGELYRIVLVNKLHLRYPPILSVEVNKADGGLKFEEKGLYGEIKGDTFNGGRKPGMKTFTMKKVAPVPPTLGAKPPEGAVVLFDGKGLDAWETPEGWTVLGDGALMVTPQGKDLLSKQKLKDVKMHVEFRLPFMPKQRGQARGNSGVFCQDVYEVQVLDSYGLEGYNNECGAMYKVSPPHVNACAPPLQWQTYDIAYRGPRFDAAGTVTEFARITVHQNGILIQNVQELPWITAWKEKERLQPPPREPGPIRLQAHNNFVQFRNIWVVPVPE
ncbi:MAG: DUF1080 domain-containing protein [Candidatus Hydrogenedentes bacterium]|nr:DUF1080 domain-containing protein [Candidatus Hydrogenedentota bacterium]